MSLDNPFHTVRFYIPRAALDEASGENGYRRIRGLRTKGFGKRDPIMHSMARHLVDVMDNRNADCAFFTDYAAIAFRDHVISTYGDIARRHKIANGGLTPHQMHKAAEFIDANLAGNPTIADVAFECGLSSSHFARAFRQTAGVAPHEWLTRRRVERAKALLRNTAFSLSEIASFCGFVDQSHISRVFTRHERITPARWRRLASH